MQEGVVDLEVLDRRQARSATRPAAAMSSVRNLIKLDGLVLLRAGLGDGDEVVTERAEQVGRIALPPGTDGKAKKPSFLAKSGFSLPMVEASQVPIASMAAFSV